MDQPAFALRLDQPGALQRGKMMRHGGRRHALMFGDRAGYHSFGASLDQHPEHREPGFVSQGTKRIDGPDLCVEIVHPIHLSRTMEIASVKTMSIDISRIVKSCAALICVKAHMRLTAYAVLMDLRINDLLTALSEPTRLRALQIIWDGDEHCVCELMDRLGATQSRMSRLMARLKVAGLLTDRP